MSERVMTLIESMVCDSEVYSIDEIFCDLSGMPGDLTEFGRTIRSKVLKHTGIPQAQSRAGPRRKEWRGVRALEHGERQA